jgi:hypothetical protein
MRRRAVGRLQQDWQCGRGRLRRADSGTNRRASFVSYSGNESQEASWRIAAEASVKKEDFELFIGTAGIAPNGEPIHTLPVLHVSFDGPPYPGAYDDTSFAHSGSEQWSNSKSGAGNASNHILRADAGYAIYALAFWNCDPQGSQPMDAYDFNDQLVGTITGLTNTHAGDPTNSDSFANFVSTVPIMYLLILGALGDGYNYFDDLQVHQQISHSTEQPFNGNKRVLFWGSAERRSPDSN